jgi:Predicted dehydrogenases and related proteins
MKKILFVLLACASAFLSVYAQNNDKKLRLAVAGVSHGHLNEVASRINRGDFEVVGVYERNESYRNNNALRKHLSDDKFFSDLGEMLDNTKPEVVVAYGSIYDHLSVVELCAPRHIDVMVERPLASTLNQAKRIEKLANKYGIKVLTNYETSWYATNNYAKTIVDEGKIGNIQRINVYDGHQGPIEIGCGKMFTDWLCDPVLNGGGAVIDFGCYGANLTTWLLHGQKPKSVYAVLKQLKPEKYPLVDDDATIIVEYPDVTVQIMASWCWPMNRKDMYIYGSNGYIYQKNGTQMEMLFGNKNTGLQEAPKLTEPYNDSFRYLKAVVRNEISITAEDLCSLENNMMVIRILDAAIRSSKKGKSCKHS